MTFTQMLAAAWQKNNSLLCVGLDPDPAKFPAHLKGRDDAILEFCTAIVDATADLVCAFKPQIAYFAARRAEDQLEALIAHIHEKHPGIPVILDAKRGDIGSTAEGYAEGYLGASSSCPCDAITVNPYMGIDTIEPFVAVAEREGKGVVVLARTSNTGSKDFQQQIIAGPEAEPLFLHVARALAQWRYRHLNDVEPIVEIFAEPPIGDGFFEVNVCRRNHAHICGDRLRATDRCRPARDERGVVAAQFRQFGQLSVQGRARHRPCVCAARWRHGRTARPPGQP